MKGTPFGRYRLVELLGRGGMGEVWRAYDTATNRMVAIKLLPPHLAQDNTFVQRFRREAETAAQLNNPHVIPIHNYGEIDGRLYVDMRLIDGRDLQDVLADGPLEPGRAVRIVEQVATALHAAHKTGLVHRDIKPSNILIDEDDFAYLIDFGIARGADQTAITSTGGVIGTLHYMAPERFSTGHADARSDIYALACVLYECLTGNRPFSGDSLEQQLAAHLTMPPPRPSTANPRLPPGFDSVIAKGMAKDPAQRYATTSELARAASNAITVPSSGPVRAVAAQSPISTTPQAQLTAPAAAAMETIGRAPAPPDIHHPAAAPSPTDPTQPAPAQPAKSAESKSVSAQDRTALPPQPRRKRMRAATLLPAVLAILLVAAAAFAAITTVRANKIAGATVPDWQPYVDAGKTSAQLLTTIDHRSADSDVQRILDNATGTFYDDFKKRSAPFIQTVREAQSTSTGTVSGAGLESLDGMQARVLVAVTVKTSNAEKPNQEPRSWRMRITVDKVGDSYKTSNVEFVP